MRRAPTKLLRSAHSNIILELRREEAKAVVVTLPAYRISIHGESQSFSLKKAVLESEKLDISVTNYS